MPVIAISPDYDQHTEPRDAPQNFHGNIVVYTHWEEHLSFCAALAFPLPPGMPFGAMVSEVIAPHYAPHPDAEGIDWSRTEWMIDGHRVAPDFAKSLAENGLHHKSVVRFWTPGRHGYHDSAS